MNDKVAPFQGAGCFVDYIIGVKNPNLQSVAHLRCVAGCFVDHIIGVKNPNLQSVAHLRCDEESHPSDFIDVYPHTNGVHSKNPHFHPAIFLQSLVL